MSTAPKMISVTSSNVEAIGHHDGDLHVRFKNGSHYVYSGVDRSTYEMAVTAGSVGKFLNDHVKGKFKHTKR